MSTNPIPAIQPTCRYENHGEMELISHSNEPADSWFMLMGTSRSGAVQLGSGFVCRIYKCRVCTYLELHDVPTEEYEATTRANNPQTMKDGQQ